MTSSARARPIAVAPVVSNDTRPHPAPLEDAEIADFRAGLETMMVPFALPKAWLNR